MNGGFEKIFRKDSGLLWYGFVRTGCAGLPQLCTSLDASDVRLFKNRAKIRAGQVGEFFIKRYNLPGFVNQFRSYFKVSRPFKVLRGAKIVEKSGFSTPQVCAVLISWSGVIRRDHLVTRMLDKNDKFLNILVLDGKHDEVWQFLLKKFTPALCRLHDNGTMHGDLSLRNLYCDSKGNAGMIDLDGIRHFSGSLAKKWRTWEMARLISSFYMAVSFVSGEDKNDLTVPAEKIAQILDAYSFELDQNEVSEMVKKFIHRGKKYL